MGAPAHRHNAGSIKLGADYNVERCSMSVVNPVTAACFVEILQCDKHAAGSVGVLRAA